LRLARWVRLFDTTKNILKAFQSRCINTNVQYVTIKQSVCAHMAV